MPRSASPEGPASGRLRGTRRPAQADPPGQEPGGDPGPSLVAVRRQGGPTGAELGTWTPFQCRRSRDRSACRLRPGRLPPLWVSCLRAKAPDRTWGRCCYGRSVGRSVRVDRWSPSNTPERSGANYQSHLPEPIPHRGPHRQFRLHALRLPARPPPAGNLQGLLCRDMAPIVCLPKSTPSSRNRDQARPAPPAEILRKNEKKLDDTREDC